MTQQHGQSLVEFSVAVFALVAVALGMELLERYQDIQRQAMLAAREQVFSAAWRGAPGSSAALIDAVRQLHFQHPGWRDPTGLQPLLPDDAALTVQTSRLAPPGLAPQLLATVLHPLQALGSGLDLPLQAYQTVQVSVPLKPLTHMPAPWSDLSLQLNESAALLADSWSAAGPSKVSSRASALVPATFLRQPLQLLQPLLLPLSLIEPAVAHLCIGLIEPERVPEDRLSPNVFARPQPGQDACR